MAFYLAPYAAGISGKGDSTNPTHSHPGQAHRDKFYDKRDPKGSPIKSRLLGHTPRSDVSEEPV